MRWTKDKYLITDDKSGADTQYIHRTLNTTYWATQRTYETVVKSLERSDLLSLFDGDTMIGYARVVGDGITFAWLCDVFIAPDYRGKGLGKWLMECVLEHPSMKDCRINLLATKDAQGLYARYGFEPKECMTRTNLREGSYP